MKQMTPEEEARFDELLRSLEAAIRARTARMTADQRVAKAVDQLAHPKP